MAYKELIEAFLTNSDVWEFQKKVENERFQICDLCGTMDSKKTMRNCFIFSWQEICQDCSNFLKDSSESCQQCGDHIIGIDYHSPCLFTLDNKLYCRECLARLSHIKDASVYRIPNAIDMAGQPSKDQIFRKKLFERGWDWFAQRCDPKIFQTRKKFVHYYTFDLKNTFHNKILQHAPNRFCDLSLFSHVDIDGNYAIRRIYYGPVPDTDIIQFDNLETHWNLIEKQLINHKIPKPLCHLIFQLWLQK